MVAHRDPVAHAERVTNEVLVPGVRQFEERESLDWGVFVELAKGGVLGVRVPRSLGGAERDTRCYTDVIRTLARGCAATAVTVAVTNMVAETLLRHGERSAVESFVRRICAGELLGVFALSETGAGSDPGSMSTRAVVTGDQWSVTGAKQWISHGNRPAVVVIWAQSHGGLSCFMTETPCDGFEVLKREDKMGLRASPTCAVSLEEVCVAPLGPLGNGLRMALGALDGGRLGIASQALGIAEAAFERGKRVLKTDGAYEGWVADSRTELDAGAALLDCAVRARDAGLPFTTQASMAKLYCSEAAQRVCERMLRVVSDAFGTCPGEQAWIERSLRDVRVTQLYEGTSEIQRLVIGRSIVGRS